MPLVIEACELPGLAPAPGFKGKCFTASHVRFEACAKDHARALAEQMMVGDCSAAGAC